MSQFTRIQKERVDQEECDDLVDSECREDQEAINTTVLIDDAEK